MFKKKRSPEAQSETPAPVAGKPSSTLPPPVERHCVVCGSTVAGDTCPVDGSNLKP